MGNRKRFPKGQGPRKYGAPYADAQIAPLICPPRGTEDGGFLASHPTAVSSPLSKIADNREQQIALSCTAQSAQDKESTQEPEIHKSFMS